MWALRYLMYIGGAFLTFQLIYYCTDSNPLTSTFPTETITSTEVSKGEPRKLVLFALTYIGYRTRKSYKSGQVQIAARELYGDQKSINIFMEPNLSYHRSFNELYIPLDEEPRGIVHQEEGLRKLVEYFQEIRGTGKKLLLFNSELKDVDRKLKEFFGDADMLEDLLENVYAVGEWYYLVYRSYYKNYPEDAEQRFHDVVTKQMTEKSEGPRKNGDTFLEHALAVQVPFLIRFKLEEANFEYSDLKILSSLEDNSDFRLTTQEEEESDWMERK